MVSPLQVYQALAGLNWRLPAGGFSAADVETQVEVGSFFRSAEEVAAAVVGVYGGRPVYLRDVAMVTDGPDEPRDYVWMLTGAAGAEKGLPAGLDASAVTVDPSVGWRRPTPGPVGRLTPALRAPASVRPSGSRGSSAARCRRGTRRTG